MLPMGSHAVGASAALGSGNCEYKVTAHYNVSLGAFA